MENFFVDHSWVIVLILLWTLPWKAAALWKSARRGQLGWFLTLMILNTLAILDILYIFAFSGKSLQQNDAEQAREDLEDRQMRIMRNRLQQEQEERIAGQQFQEAQTIFSEEEVYQINVNAAPARSRQKFL